MQHVLALRALGLGDFLTAVPALRGLRAHFPDSHLTLATTSWLEPLVRLTGVADETLPTGGLTGIDPAVRPDVAINLHGCGPHSIDVLVQTGCKTLLTHAHPDRPDIPGCPWINDMHETARWCRLLEFHGIATDPADFRLPCPRTPSSSPGAVVIHPGAASRARQWPPERYAAVARSLRECGHTVIVTGTEAESSLVSAVVDGAGLPHTAGMAGTLTLLELCSLVAESSLVICGDTGVAHLASAFEAPSIVLFGPTPPSQWGPPTGGPHRVLWYGTTGDPHGAEPDPGLLRIAVDDVVSAVARRGVIV
ncbi:glycosyltransferase family 9 protein [Rhodococcus sovatensis]|uniref:Glycosyltransferase family 9 protein n=1 Tax=Rhodococcus sovatensis TaxID=1805840 RepID=A0ABZ2PK66_9NOCA